MKIRKPRTDKGWNAIDDLEPGTVFWSDTGRFCMVTDASAVVCLETGETFTDEAGIHALAYYPDAELAMGKATVCEED